MLRSSAGSGQSGHMRRVRWKPSLSCSWRLGWRYNYSARLQASFQVAPGSTEVKTTLQDLKLRSLLSKARRKLRLLCMTSGSTPCTSRPDRSYQLIRKAQVSFLYVDIAYLTPCQPLGQTTRTSLIHRPLYIGREVVGGGGWSWMSREGRNCKGTIRGSRRSMSSYILVYLRLKDGTCDESRF